MLEKLCNLNGVSGCEDAVRDFIKSEISPFCDEIKTDKIGNLYAFKKGRENGKTLLLCAHMDEVGFIVTSITDDGYLKFSSVGGIDDRILLGQRVKTVENGIKGVIGIKAIHLTTKAERGNVVKESDMYIDIGAKNKEEAEKLVKKGDYIAFDSQYEEFGETKIKAKALDDRIGCDVMIDLIKTAEFYHDTWLCFTVQEEVGLRGAAVAGDVIKPDFAIIVEGTTCNDVYGVDPHEQVTCQGGGPALSVLERSSRSDKDFIKFITETAKENGIACQFKRTCAGGNDAGNIQIAGGGVKTAAIAVPCRYLHSPVSVIDKRDFEGLKNLLNIVVRKDLSNIWSF